MAGYGVPEIDIARVIGIDPLDVTVQIAAGKRIRHSAPLNESSASR